MVSIADSKSADQGSIPCALILIMSIFDITPFFYIKI